jgi:hypothetical protein
MKRATIEHLHAVAQERKSGYLEACLREGKVSSDGRWVHFTDEAHARLRQQYNPDSLSVSRWRQRGGARAALGDIIHKIAGPIGRAVRWPCLKGDGTTELKPGSPCDRARRALNIVKV